MEVFIDTNFLVLPFTEKIDIFDERVRLVESPKIVVIDKVLNELKKVKPKLYDPVLKLLKIKKVRLEEVDLKGSVDSILIELASSRKGAIATLDRLLKQKALKQGVPIISVRGNKLEMRW